MTQEPLPEYPDMRIGIDQGSGDETCIRLRIGDNYHTIRDPFASKLNEMFVLQDNLATQLSAALKRCGVYKKALQSDVECYGSVKAKQALQRGDK